MKRGKKYTKSEAWQKALYKQRIATAKRNVEIYKAMIPPIQPGTIELLMNQYDVSDKRLYQIRSKVQKMIDDNEIDLELFGT